eukprot:XP_011673728.1 PREDICTED: uncharacterized protein LOC105442822 [Strongylocentrotus purpuratus]
MQQRIPALPTSQDLRDRSETLLTLEEKTKLKALLHDYQEVAKVELVLGKFTTLTHKIDTGDARPIKQKMPRTPINFANEKGAHLEKMLKAGVIQPSISEWASPLVLIRKRDGSVRWHKRKPKPLQDHANAALQFLDHVQRR